MDDEANALMKSDDAAAFFDDGPESVDNVGEDILAEAGVEDAEETLDAEE